MNVELPLISETYDLHNIHASLANEDQHQRFGLLFPEWMPKLNFNIVENNRGTFLNVTSSQAIKEPIVNFVIAIQYQELVLYKEITLFLDPAGLTQQSETKVRAKQVNETQIQFQNKVPSSYISDIQSFTVERGQSLWRIARAWKLPNASINEKIQAIYLNNPHAFINGDKNRLKQGSLLTLSSSALKLEPEVSKKTVISVNNKAVEASNKPQIQVDNNELSKNTQLNEKSLQNELVNELVAERLKIDKEIIDLNNTIVKQQALNLSLRNQLKQLQEQVILQQQIAQVVSEKTVTSPTATVQPLEKTSILPVANLSTDNKSSLIPKTDTQANDAVPFEGSTISAWLTAIWFVLALVVAYLGTILSSKRKAKKFAKKLDHKLHDMAYSQERVNSQTPSVKELSIPKNLPTSVQIKYLNSAADFYLRCNRYDLAKELVNQGLIQFSGNTQVIRALNKIRKRTISQLDVDLHDEITEKLEQRNEKDLTNDSTDNVDSDELSLEEFQDEWFKQWNKKAS